MAIDRPRYERFRRELSDVVDRLPADELAKTIRSKLLDWALTTDFADLSQRELTSIFDRLLGDDFQGYAASIVRSYDSVIDVVNTLYTDLGLDVDRDLQRIRAIERANAAYVGQYEEAMKERIARHVRQAAAAQDPVEELIGRLEQIEGLNSHYARAIGETQVKRVGRGAKNEKARVAEVDFFEYVGVIRDTSRPFCVDHAGRTYRRSTILALRNGNLEPVMLNCGGWRCVHDWEPDPFATEES